jgi:hypothetical protein
MLKIDCLKIKIYLPIHLLRQVQEPYKLNQDSHKLQIVEVYMAIYSLIDFMILNYI